MIVLYGLPHFWQTTDRLLNRDLLAMRMLCIMQSISPLVDTGIQDKNKQCKILICIIITVKGDVVVLLHAWYYMGRAY